MFMCITFHILYTWTIYISDNKIILNVGIAESKEVLIVHFVTYFPIPERSTRTSMAPSA